MKIRTDTKTGIILKTKYPVLVAVLLVVCALWFTACDNTLEPFDQDIGIFSVYGVLDMNEETHYVRIREMSAPFTAEATRDMDATVFFDRPGTGDSEILESDVREYEGVFLHTYRIEGAIEAGTTYRLRVIRSDGVSVEAETTSPTYSVPVTDPENVRCHVPADVEFGPVNGGVFVLRVGTCRDDDCWGAPYILRPGENGGNGMYTFRFLGSEQLLLLSAGKPNSPRCGGGNIMNFYISYTHYAPGFYEQIENDPFDIQASFLRFGALYRDTLTIPVDMSREL
jgi:predicted small secreted protein